MKEKNCTNSPIMPHSGKCNDLYLARSIYDSPLRYSLRQSYQDEATGLLCHRHVFDLGENPEQFIIYIEDNGYYIDDELIDAIQPFQKGDAEKIVEELLWPFVRKDVRDNLEPFRDRGRYTKISPLTAEERAAIDREIHIFDRRRLHYLWYGSVDQSGLYRMPDKLCRKILGKSRDEKEQFFISREGGFYADEVKQYLYAVFNLQEHFTESYARIMPEGLSEEKLDACFVEAICRLNRDACFTQGLASVPGLQPYLIRYLILFFDYDFGASQALDDYIRQFINNHRAFRFPKRESTVTIDEAGRIFGETSEKLQGLSKKELTKLYRSKAKKLHPDIGGEHDEFVRLTAAFEELLRNR
ncbi:MAG: J domain-containing protein [Pseudomonadota bacterium]